jgi:hypothetical protein
MVRQSWVVWQQGRLLSQLLVLGLEMCELKFLLVKFRLQVREVSLLLLMDPSKVLDFLSFLAGPLRLSLSTPQQRGSDHSYR